MGKKKTTKKIKGLKHKKIIIDGASVKTFNAFKEEFGINKLFPHKKLSVKTALLIRFDFFLKEKKQILGEAVKLSVIEDLKFLAQVNNFKFNRHKKKLPVRGQRTKTNAKTQKKFKRS
jgi:ribosomal protein S13